MLVLLKITHGRNGQLI